MNNIIHIDINIPFYTFACHDRYLLTEIIFQHYLNIKERFKEKARFTFTLIGSENKLSMDLALKYFNDKEDIYIEFDQDRYNSTVGFLNMITEKFRISFKSSFEKQPNISLLAGSNDLIDFNFFNQIIDSYDNKKKQIFGIDNYKNNNFVLFLKNYYSKNLINGEYFIWNGQYPDQFRSKYNYTGGNIGFNDILYKTEYEVLINKIITYDEGMIEYDTLKLDNISKFNSNNVLFLNIKTSTSKEITSFKSIQNYIGLNSLDYKILSDENKLKIKNIMDYLNILYTEKYIEDIRIKSIISQNKYENNLRIKIVELNTIKNTVLKKLDNIKEQISSNEIINLKNDYINLINLTNKINLLKTNINNFTINKLAINQDLINKSLVHQQKISSSNKKYIVLYNNI